MQNVAVALLSLSQPDSQPSLDKNPQKRIAVPETADWTTPLKQSLLFYQAQRSGKLPDKDVPWRTSAFLNDRTTDGIDMTGGFFDAGDYVHFMLPQATTLTALASGLLVFESGYKTAGQLRQARKVVAWGADFLAKCVISPTRLVAQVGNGQADHATWTRPDEIKEPYPVYELNPTKPGSDLAGSYAAALAASSAAFRQAGDTQRASLYLRKARMALEFGIKYPGRYSASLTDPENFYQSTSHWDDLALGAMMLYHVTKEQRYLDLGKLYFRRHMDEEQGVYRPPANDWDNQQYMAAALLVKYAPFDLVEQSLTRFQSSWMNVIMPVQKTPKGFLWLDKWGASRHNQNAMFLMIYAAHLTRDTKQIGRAVCLARSQVRYLLGSTTGQSFVVGRGPSWPKQPHHRAASCPLAPTPCGWDYFNSPKPNPQVLLGALVGGPGLNDEFEDERSDYIKNEVAIDYNSGYTGVLAALLKYGGLCG